MVARIDYLVVAAVAVAVAVAEVVAAVSVVAVALKPHYWLTAEYLTVGAVDHSDDFAVR